MIGKKIMAAVAIVAAALTLAVAAPVATAPPAEAATYHCQHRVTNGVWFWDNRDSYTTGIWEPTRHPVSKTLHVTGQVCLNSRAPDRFREISTTSCLTDSRHSDVHTGTTFDPYFHTLENSTKVNPPPYRVVEDGSPEHRCARRAIARSIQRWVTFLSRPVVSVVSTHRLKVPYPDPSTIWRTRSGSRDRRIYQSDVHLLGPAYWPGY